MSNVILNGYNGQSLVMLGDNLTFAFPMHYISEGSYEPSYNVLDVNSKQTTSGMLIRQVAQKVRPQVSFSVKSLTNTQYANLMHSISELYVGDSRERKVYCSFFIPEYNQYLSSYCYLVQPKVVIQNIDKNNVIHYQPTTFEFISYGGEHIG